MFADWAPDERGPPLDGAVVRDVVPADLLQLARIAQQRNGGDLERYRASLQGFLEQARLGKGLVLTAALADSVLGYAKCAYFTPPEDAPPNIAPAGWYLSGVTVDERFRRRGVGTQLTRARLDWIAERADCAWYFANGSNRVSIALHRRFGFEEATRDFVFPGSSFEGDVGILFRVSLK